MFDHGWTTIRLTREEDEWIATQPEVEVVGRGDTAQWAAADYCRRVAENVDEE